MFVICKKAKRSSSRWFPLFGGLTGRNVFISRGNAMRIQVLIFGKMRVFKVSSRKTAALASELIPLMLRYGEVVELKHKEMQATTVVSDNLIGVFLALMLPFRPCVDEVIGLLRTISPKHAEMLRRIANAPPPENTAEVRDMLMRQCPEKMALLRSIDSHSEAN